MTGRIASTLGVLVLALMAAPAAQAMQEGWFFEVAVGQANFSSVKTSELNHRAAQVFDWYSLDFTPGDATLKHRDRSYAVISGYRFNRQLALEVGYIRLGAFQYAVTGTVGEGENAVPATANMSFRAKGVSFGVVGSLPMGDILELRARAGLSTSDTRFRYSVAVMNSGPPREAMTASSQDFYIGAGIGMNVGDYYRIGVDWMRHRNMGKMNLSYRANVDNLLLSVNYQY